MGKIFLKSTILCCLLFGGQIRAEKHVIRTWNTGFFSSFLGVLNHLDWCEKTGSIPAVYWGKESAYWQEGGYNDSLNAWEYFFEPVSCESISADECEGCAVGYTAFYFKSIDYKKRMFANSLIHKYIKINDKVGYKLESFFVKNMEDKKTIGIHLRGTDKYIETRVVDPKLIFERANKEAEILGDCQFLVATDEFRLLVLAEKTLKRPVIYYPCERSASTKPLHIHTHKAILGEDVLIESLLLSRCDIFLHTYSNVSRAVLYFNPYLKNILFA